MLTIKKLDIEVEKRKVQIEIIRSCIIKSKYIVIANAAKYALRNAKFFVARFPGILPSENCLNELNDELDNKIYEYKRHVSIALRNIIGKRPIHIEDLFWFSLSDLKHGYILLYPNTHTQYADHVLFLVETRDTFDGIIYFPGDIRPFRQVNHVLTNIKGFTETDLGIGFKYASKAEMLNELSTLSSIIKSNKNERTGNFKSK